MKPSFIDLWMGLKGKPGRSFISFFSIFCASCALALLISIMDGLSERAQKMIEDIGIDTVRIHSGESLLKSSHADILSQTFIGADVGGIRILNMRSSLSQSPISVAAVSGNFFQARPVSPVMGRLLDSHDIAHASRHAVLSDLFIIPQSVAPNSFILLDGIPFTIVGVIAQGHSDEFSKSALYLPLTSLAPDFAESDAALDAIYIKLNGTATPEKAAAIALQVLSFAGENSITCITPATLLSGVRKIQRQVFASAGSAVLLFLILAGTTLMSLMTASVRERVQEIGLRRALGAVRKNILFLFLLESLAICASAGIFGTFAAIALTALIQKTTALPSSLGWNALLLPTLSSIFLGAIFTWLPAYKASIIQPSDALRND